MDKHSFHVYRAFHCIGYDENGFPCGWWAQTVIADPTSDELESIKKESQRWGHEMRQRKE